MLSKIKINFKGNVSISPKNKELGGTKKLQITSSTANFEIQQLTGSLTMTGSNQAISFPPIKPKREQIANTHSTGTLHHPIKTLN